MTTSIFSYKKNFSLFQPISFKTDIDYQLYHLDTR